MGYEVAFCASTDQYSELLKEEGFYLYGCEFGSGGGNLFQRLTSIIKFKKILNKFRPDFCLTFTLLPNLCAGFLNYKTNYKQIVNITGMGRAYIGGNLKKKVFDYIYKVALRNTNLIFVQNKEDFLHFSNVLYFKNVAVLPGSGVNIRAFPKINSDTLYQNKNIIYIGRLINEKGIQELISVWKLIHKILPEYSLKLIGKCNDVGIREQIDEMPNTCYIGHSDNVFDILKTGFLFVYPTKYREGTPRAILEAMSIGLPVITTNMPGCNEVVRDGENGYICEPGDTRQLKFGIRKCCNLTFLDYDRLSNNAREQIVFNYSEDRIVKNYLRVMGVDYQNLL